MRVRHKIVQLINVVEVDGNQFLYALDKRGAVWRMSLKCGWGTAGHWEHVKDSPHHKITLPTEADKIKHGL